MSLLGIRNHHYKLPSNSSTLSSVAAEDYPDVDSHVFMSGTNCPFKANELHVIQYSEGSGEISALAALSFKEEISCTTCIDVKTSETKVNYLTAIASKICAKEQEYMCGLYDVDIGSAGHSQMNYLKNLSDAHKSYAPIQRVLNDPHAEAGGASKRLAIVDKNGFYIYDISDETDELYSKFVNNTEKQSTQCYWGTFDPHHYNSFITADSEALRGWDLRTPNVVFKKSKSETGSVMCVDCNPNIPNCIASGGQDGCIRFWDIRCLNKSLKIINRAHSHWVTSLLYNPCHDQLLLSAGTDASIILHEVMASASPSTSSTSSKLTHDTSRVLHTYNDHQDSVYDMCWSGNDIWCFASISNDGRISVNQIPSEEKFRLLL